MEYFNNPKTAEDLKKQYHELAFKYHPDKNGSNEVMKIINAEYEQLFLRLKDIHITKDGEMYTAEKPTGETAEQFKDLISELLKMNDIIIEIIGCFVWVTGNTKTYKEKLKELKFQWHAKKSAWYLKPDGYKRRSRKDYSFDEIREMYGTHGTMKSKGVLNIDEAHA